MINSFQDAKSLLLTAEKAFNDKAYQQSAEIVEDVARYGADPSPPNQSDGLTAGQKAELTQIVKQAIGRFTFCPDECVWEETSALMDLFRD